MNQETELKLVVGRTYRGKKPAAAGSMFQPLVNDRTLVYVGMYEVQYDSPSVAHGRKYPKLTIEQFQRWAKRDVTDELPKGEYASWPITKAEAVAA